jgi:hypothetical protein
MQDPIKPERRNDKIIHFRIFWREVPETADFGQNGKIKHIKQF